MTDVKTSSGVQRFRLPPTFSLLWTLGPAPDSLECPISFSPFLPFGTLENTAGNGGIFLFLFFYIKFIGLTSIFIRIFAGCFTLANQCVTIGCNAALAAPDIKKRIRYQFLI